jgi:methyl-accepting chemotaxis protein
MNTKRTQVIIKNEFQYKLILSTLLITLITLNVIIMAASVLEGMYASEKLMFSVFNVSVGVMEVVAVVIVYYVSRRMSFRIAGPVYAIERTLKGMGEGDLTQTLKLRPGDQFNEAADSINAVLSNYRERIARIQALLAASPELSEQQRQLVQDELKWFVTERED